jgi:hypothetical protein
MDLDKNASVTLSDVLISPEIAFIAGLGKQCLRTLSDGVPQSSRSKRRLPSCSRHP